jgi:hypothetical protein
MKLLAIALSGAKRELEEEMLGGDLSKIQCKAIQNCHNESSKYRKYILIKWKKRKCNISLLIKQHEYILG